MKSTERTTNVIVLLTDFGLRDGFAGAMKGVILGINPKATVVDLTHEIPPQDVNAAAYVLWSTHSFFARGTIFLVVVDPGVGTERRILCVEGRNHIFLAPDNGVLKYLEADGLLTRAWEVRNERYFLSHVSSTFHGRDIFAPVAARLSLGLNPSKLGRRVALSRPRREFAYLDGRKTGKYLGNVIHIDRFGNLITNLRLSPGEGLSSGRLTVRIKSRVIQGLSQAYAQGSPNRPVALINSSNLIEIGVRNGSARELLKAKVGDKVMIEIKNR
ncbi:MAG: SAM-dependent chlorinase/fluorinase [Bacteroidota bacterium]